MIEPVVALDRAALAERVVDAEHDARDATAYPDRSPAPTSRAPHRATCRTGTNRYGLAWKPDRVAELVGQLGRSSAGVTIWVHDAETLWTVSEREKLSSSRRPTVLSASAVAERERRVLVEQLVLRGRRRACATGSRSRARTSSRRAASSEPKLCDSAGARPDGACRGSSSATPARRCRPTPTSRRRRRSRATRSCRRDIGRAPATSGDIDRSCDRCRRRPGSSTRTRCRRGRVDRATASDQQRASVAAASAARRAVATRRAFARLLHVEIELVLGGIGRELHVALARASRAGAAGRGRSRRAPRARATASRPAAPAAHECEQRARRATTQPSPLARSPRSRRSAIGSVGRRARRSARRPPRRRRRSCRSGTPSVPLPPLPSTAATYAVIVPAPAAGAVQHRSHEVIAVVRAGVRHRGAVLRTRTSDVGRRVPVGARVVRRPVRTCRPGCRRRSSSSSAKPFSSHGLYGVDRRSPQLSPACANCDRRALVREHDAQVILLSRLPAVGEQLGRDRPRAAAPIGRGASVWQTSHVWPAKRGAPSNAMPPAPSSSAASMIELLAGRERRARPGAARRARRATSAASLARSPFRRATRGSRRTADRRPAGEDRAARVLVAAVRGAAAASAGASCRRRWRDAER